MNEAIRRGEDAKRLLDEPLFVEAFGKIEAAILNRLRTVDVGALETQRDLIVTLQLLGKLRQYIEQVAVTGRLEQIEQERVSLESKLRGRGRRSAVSGS